jgi:DNA helicase II / ATP-dependent DNA helicase PcrA
MELSKEQRIAVDKTGKFIVVAPPGSGKTFLLCEKTKEFLQKYGKRIIVLTFSNKAASEIQSRIDDNEKLFIGTIHSYAQNLVNSRGHLIGLPKNTTIVSDEKDKIVILKEIIRDSEYLSTQMKDYITGNRDIKRPLDFIKKQKLKFQNPDDFLVDDSKHSELYYELYNAYLKKMQEYNLLDFDDLLYYAHKILSMDNTQKMLSSVYSSVFIDEAQDLNYSQYELIKLIANNIDNVMLIGDPEQSLYGFMDSSCKYMVNNFIDDFKGDKIELHNNYRSAKKIVNLINHFTPEKKSINNFPIEGHVEYTLHENEEAEAKDVVSKIKKYLSTFDFKEEDIAIIGRNSYLFTNITNQLEENNIPYNTGNSNNIVFESFYVQLLIQLIKLHCNEKDISVKQKIADLTKKTSFDMEYIKNEYSEIYDLSLISSFRMFSNKIASFRKKIIDSTNFSENDKYMIVNDLDVLIENIKNYNMSKNSDLKNVTDFLNDFTMGKTINFKQDGISLLTIHKSKGLEFQVVFLIGLSEGVLPDYRADTDEKLLEEKNNVFVGLSRSKRDLYLSSVEYKMMPWGKLKKQVESRYLETIRQSIDTEEML